MPSKDGWTLECMHEKVTLGKKQYRNMEEWFRPCGICGNKFSIHVRANGGSVNNSFGLRTCKEHRGQKIGGEASMVFEQYEELERLRGWEAMFFRILDHVQKKVPGVSMLNLEECLVKLTDAADKAFAEYNKQAAELHALKLRLAPYDLPTAMAAQNKFPWGENSS